MLPDSPAVRRALAVAAVVLVVAALTTVVVVSGGDDGELTASTGTSSTTAATDSAEGDPATAPDDAGEGEPGEPSPAPTAAPSGSVEGDGQAGGGTTGSTSDTQAPPPTTGQAGLGEAEDPGPAVAPKAGTYVYAYSREGSEGAETGERNVVVTDEGEAAGEHRQTIRYEGDEGGSFTNDVAWRSDGVYVMVTRFDFGGQTGECDWEPDFRIFALPLEAGSTWSYETSCTVMFGTTPVEIERTGSFTVGELTRIEVAGEAVDVWPIESVEDTTLGAFGSSTEETTAYFSPRHGLRVKVSTKGSGSGQGRTESWTEEREIKNLSPQ